MLQAYFEEGMDQDAVFSLFVRRLPESRNFLLACGLGTSLDWLADFRFEGDVYALPEGTPVFANEPILEVVAPITQGQLLFAFLLTFLSSFGQTFFIGLFGSDLRLAAGLDHGSFGSIYSAATLASAMCLYAGGGLGCGPPQPSPARINQLHEGLGQFGPARVIFGATGNQ